jgi:succinate dehydrogenase/fumarate reductase flavoprotein subunit
MDQVKYYNEFDGPIEWQYPIKYGEETEIEADVLVLGAGVSGCMAAIAAAKKGLKVVLVDKGCVKHSGAAGAGVDHWMDCPSNPASKITPEEYLKPLDKYKGGYANYIGSYITAKDSWEALLELEEMGMQIRDVNDEFKGADFRDEETKLTFAYDYTFNHCVRIWGTQMKPSLYKRCKELGVNIVERTMATSLLTEDGKQGSRLVGATGVNVRTGEFSIFKAKSCILCMATPEHVWIFSTEHTGLVGRDGPPTNAGNGFAMAWRAGAEFVRMEASTREEWGGSTGIGTIMFGSGSSFATWFPCSIIDAKGKEIPWVGKDGKELINFSQRTNPKSGDGFFCLVLGGKEDQAVSLPQLTPHLAEKIKQGEYTLPLYADLPGVPDEERRAIFGLMVGQEGHTWSVYRNLTQAGFNPDKDLLQVYELADAPMGWRRLRYGGLIVDWNLSTNIKGLYAAGQQMYDGMGVAHAASTGRWAGSHAAEYSLEVKQGDLDQNQIKAEKDRVLAPVKSTKGIDWKEMAAGLAKIMQDYCGDIKTDELMKIGQIALDEVKKGEAMALTARNPHELMRALEVLDIHTVCEMIIAACQVRKASNSWIFFDRMDYPEDDPEEWRKWLTIKLEGQKVTTNDLPLDYYGSITENYNKHKIT